MKVELAKPFAANSKVDQYDVRQLKKSLNRLGYYQPYEKTGITGIPDREIFDALKTFQQDQDFKPTGEARPGDETIEALNVESAKTPDGYYIWRTVEDGKVRANHAEFNRTIRSWSDSPDPGEDFNCRCWAEPIDSRIAEIDDTPLEPFYPEIFLIPLLRTPKLFNAWRIWIQTRNTEWHLGKFKSQTRWSNQLRDRDWTPEQIAETIKNGKKFSAPNKVNPGNKATRYEFNGRYVVRDEKTKEILQISEPDFVRPEIKN
jgi:hypothetical protein